MAWSIKRKSITDSELKEYLVRKAQKNVRKLERDHDNVMFVWKKKIEQEVIVKGVSPNAYSLKSEKKRKRERMEEIEKLKKRREWRALEKQRREEGIALIVRESARAEFERELEKKEKEFQFFQSKVRSEIRLREGRAKPIDFLIWNLSPLDDHMDLLEATDPCAVFSGLTVEELKELRDEIMLHFDIDKATETHTKYWEALLIVCEWKLAETHMKDALGEQVPLNEGTEKDVTKLLEDMSHEQLAECQASIESKMQCGMAQVVEFWEAVLKRLPLYKAKAFLKEIHSKMRDNLHRVEQPLEHEGRVEVLNTKEEDGDYSEAGSFSPVLLAHSDDYEDVIDPLEDKAILEIKRANILKNQKRTMNECNQEKLAMTAMASMEEGDVRFGSGAEISLDSKLHCWNVKYQPRKPKYFNLVHTGYTWNKYNQTHYDRDNPPPKAVQGYKFNVFYPDLVDKTKVPGYKLEEDGKSSETCIVRFVAGPPYQDIAFRIINKEWERSTRKGYKCTFEGGILRVHFNFKRFSYRR